VNGGLRVICAECGAETAEVAQFCVRCGAPAVGQPPVAAHLAVAGPGDSAPIAAGRDPGSRPELARRRYFRMFLVCCLTLCCVILNGVLLSLYAPSVSNNTSHSALDNWIGGTIAVVGLVSLCGAVVFLVAFANVERFPEFASGHTVDRAGATHIFRTHRGIRVVGVLGFAVMLVCLCAVIIAHGPQGGFNVWVKIAFIVGFVVPSAWFGVRWFRAGVAISPGRMTVRNLWRTRVIAIDEIHRIDLATRRGDHASPPHWVPRIDLTSGDSLWMDGLSCGTAHSPPDPEGLTALGELQALIGLQTMA
jgi:hypothetical protein